MEKFINTRVGRVILYTLLYGTVYKLIGFEITIITMMATVLAELDFKK